MIDTIDELARLIAAHREMGDAQLRTLMVKEPGFLDNINIRVPRSIESLAARMHTTGDRALTLSSKDYPARIKHFLGAGAPPVLYFHGNWELIKKPSVSIIGARRPAASGAASARAYAAALAGARRVVTSGNARGIDAAAHDGALHAGGDTIVLPPAPLDSYEPSFHAQPARNSVLVISGFVPGIETQLWHFHARNMLVAAHAGAAIVAETGARGGTLNTVAHVRAFGRPLFVLCVAADSPRAFAHQQLIAGGAIAVPPMPSAPVIQQIVECADSPMAEAHDQMPDLFSPETAP